MVKIKQERVNKRTLEFDNGTPDAKRDTDGAKEQAEELSHKQKKVEALLREMANRLSKEQAGQ